jgi:ectoine hydroxylase-related dioxygenase (phytanoyl-CoA dioxygenase family)
MNQTQNLLDQEYKLTTEQIQSYRKNGFIKIDNVLVPEVLAQYRETIANAVDKEKQLDALGRVPETNISEEAAKFQASYGKVFTQRVNLWQRHQEIHPLLHSKRLAGMAAAFMGAPARVWHDQALFKEPNGDNKTPWHQDTPYWPHGNVNTSPALSIWIALKDATLQNGCMSYMPGSHHLGAKAPINLADGNPEGVYQVAPELKGVKPETIELKAGSAAFHCGLCFHYAGPNRSNATREAYVIIYMPDGTTFNGNSHIVTEGLNLEKGALLNRADYFPLVS